MDRVGNHQHSLSLSDKKQQQSHSNKVWKSRRYQSPRKWLEILFSEISGGTSCISRNSVLNIQRCKQTLHLFRKDSYPTLQYAILFRSYSLKAPPALPQRAQILFCPQMHLTAYTTLLPLPSCTLHQCSGSLKPMSLSLFSMALLEERQSLLQKHGSHSPGLLSFTPSSFFFWLCFCSLKQVSLFNSACTAFHEKNPPALSKTIHSESQTPENAWWRRCFFALTFRVSSN